MTQNMNLVFGVNFDLLKTNLTAIYEKTDQKSALLVMPTTVNSPNTVKLGEMVDEFKNAFGIEGAGDKIKGNLENVQNEKSPFKWDEIGFQLKAAFYIRRCLENRPKVLKKLLKPKVEVGQFLIMDLPNMHLPFQ